MNVSHTGEAGGWRLQLGAAAIQGQHSGGGRDYPSTTAPGSSGGVHVVIRSTRDFLGVKIQALSTSRSFLGPSEPRPTKADLGGKVQLHGQGHTRVTGMMLDHVCPIFSFGSLGPRSKEHTDSGRVARPFPTCCPRPCLPLPPRPPRGTAARGLQLGGLLKDCSNLDLFP